MGIRQSLFDRWSPEDRGSAIAVHRVRKVMAAWESQIQEKKITADELKRLAQSQG